MKEALIKTGVGILSFFVSLMVFSSLLNKGATDMTADLQQAGFPVVSFLSGDEDYNPTFGYTVKRNPALMKENITPMGENRSVAFEIECFGKEVDEIHLEVRTVDGGRLIEDTQIKDFENDGDYIDVYTSLKDLLKEGEEYALTIRLNVEGRDVYYNTRVVPREEVDVQTYLEFTEDFTGRTFGDKEQYQELKKYLESNSGGDNSDFGYVNIHSSLEQVAWGNLQVELEGEIHSRLLTIEKDSATLIQYYLVKIGEGKSEEHYRVEEYFRLRRGTQRMHLIDYERTMSRLVFEEDNIFFQNTLYLGINSGTIDMEESPEGTKMAFVKDGTLFVANPSENKFARAYSPYDKDNYYLRPMTELPDIRILSVEEDGRTDFAVYGYLSRGEHEGECGLLVYSFDFTKNVLEEKMFVPYYGSPEMLKANISKLIHLNSRGKVFFFLDGGIFETDLETLETEEVAKALSPDAFSINETQTMGAWMTEGAELGARVIELENFETMNRIEIKAKNGELLKSLGFMGDDLVYGTAREEDVSRDAYGNVHFPMFSVKIQTEEGMIYKNYSEEGFYVTECAFEDNMLSLEREKKDENGNFTAATGDSIVDNTPEKSGKNKLESVVTENYETVWQIALTKEFNSGTLQLMRPKVMLFEDDLAVDVSEDEFLSYYFTYAKGKVTGIWGDEADAVRCAFEENGFVLNGRSRYIWEKKDLQTKNQIMAIKEATVPENSGPLAVCLETIMKYEGFSQDADNMLLRGMSPVEILEKYMMDREILDLTGCPMDVVYYYLSRDIPVMVITGENNAILLTGYNSGELVWMEPAKGTLHKVSKSESEKVFKENSNRYITYCKDAD